MHFPWMIEQSKFLIPILEDVPSARHAPAAAASLLIVRHALTLGYYNWCLMMGDKVSDHVSEIMLPSISLLQVHCRYLLNHYTVILQ
jgi:hypothetical protein